MDKVWWNQVTNADRFVRLVAEAMLEGRSVVLALPENVPWYAAMQARILDEVKKQNSRYSFEFIDSPGGGIGEYLLRQYCGQEKWSQYRPGPGRSCARFLAENEDIVLNEKYIWVKNIPAGAYAEWMNFLSEYREYTKKGAAGVFVLETADEALARRAKKGIAKISFDKEISAYDKYTFCALAAAEAGCKEYLKHYLASLVSNLCGDDIELCGLCVKNAKSFLADPAGTLAGLTARRIKDSPQLACCQAAGKAGEEAGMSQEPAWLEKKLWETQLRIVFPLIEDYRSSFVNRHSSAIAKLLPLKSSNGEEFTEPSEVEIGTLDYMVSAGQLRVVNEKERRRLFELKQARNTLAHLKTLPPDEVEAILLEESLPVDRRG